MALCRSGAVLALLAAAGSIAAQVTRTGHGYLFRARYHRGEVVHYESRVDALGSAIVTPITVKVGKKTREKAGDKVADISYVSVHLDTPYALPSKDRLLNVPPRTNLLRLDPLNKVLGSNAGGDLAVQFSDKPVPVGGTWDELQFFQLSSNKGVAMRVRYLLKAIKVLGSRRVAVLGLVMHGLAEGTGSTTVDMSDGSLISSAMDIQLGVNNEGRYPVKVHVTRK